MQSLKTPMESVETPCWRLTVPNPKIHRHASMWLTLTNFALPLYRWKLPVVNVPPPYSILSQLAHHVYLICKSRHRHWYNPRILNSAHNKPKSHQHCPTGATLFRLCLIPKLLLASEGKYHGTRQVRAADSEMGRGYVLPKPRFWYHLVPFTKDPCSTNITTRWLPTISGPKDKHWNSLFTKICLIGYRSLRFRNDKSTGSLKVRIFSYLEL